MIIAGTKESISDSWNIRLCGLTINIRLDSLVG